MKQAHLQGVFNKRVDHLNHYRRVMADIQLELNLISETVTIIFNKKTSDIYMDSIFEEESRVPKKVLISKNPDMAYVIDSFDELEEREDLMPWLVVITLTDLPRHLNHTDQIITENGQIYRVSRAMPINRLNDSVQKVLIYNERIDTQLADTSVTVDDDHDLWDGDTSFETKDNPTHKNIYGDDL